jgi:hypothetical protein
MALSAEGRLAILDLIARYNHALDTGGKEAYAATWAEDGVFELGAQETVRGRAAIRDRFANPPPEEMRIRHWTTNPVIGGDGDWATLRLDVMAIRIDAHGRQVGFSGAYDDRLERVGGAWKSAHRRLIPDGP